jgi:sRNA-binding regulator protein Hfq
MDQRLHRPAFQKRVPPKSTSAEGFYYIKQKDSKTPMVIKLLNGEEIRGVIEWYDENCLKIQQLDGSGVVIRKSGIKYMYKQNK